MEKNKKLEMSFDPHTIEHLGVKMYSVLPNAIAELIANAYDAEAKNVYIKLYDREGNKSIVVIDDGLGMSFDELNEKFLRIGRKRRIEDNGMSPNGVRKVTGRKGLGKLAFFGIGDTIQITTKKKGRQVEFLLNWSEIKNSTSSTYEPKFKISNCNFEEKGTMIELKDLKRKSSFNKKDLALSISKLFNLFDSNFKVYISLNDDKVLLIDNKLKYENLDKQIEWIFPNNSDVKNEYLDNKNISGSIIATEKPLNPGLRGITLFAHGRLVNIPEFFGVGESSHGYSYLTGWLNVDFVDEQEEDVISTDRQSLNWDLPITNELRNNLQRLLKDIEKDWREKRKIEKQKQISNKSKINIDEWYGKLPENIKNNVEKIVGSVYDSELSVDKQKDIIETLHGLIPEYVYYHFRHLHEKIRNISFEYYKDGNYYTAVLESIKEYEDNVKLKSGRSEKGPDLMRKVFGSEDTKVLTVVAKYKKTDGTDFSKDTIVSIENGQQELSAGVVCSARNPLSHEKIKELKGTNLFTEEDCLDTLSLLSHLFRRLDDAEKK